MNYYDELGLAPSASVEEIRQAYKTLARLLHPDHQRDANLRKMAEVQMTRLNEVLTVLTDPAQRERYDASLRTIVALPQVDEAPPRGWRRILALRIPGVNASAILWSAGLIVAASGFAFVLLYFMHDSGGPVYQSGDVPTRSPQRAASTQTVAGPAAAPPVGPIRLQPVHAGTPPAERPPAEDSEKLDVPHAPEPPPAETPAVAPASQRVEPQPALPVAVTPPPRPSQPTAPERQPTSLIGTWLYVKPVDKKTDNSSFQYRPEYIELVIKPAEPGKVLGRYRGRFHVPDKPLSSEVVFQFEGPDDGADQFSWHSGDGARGQVRMKVIADGVMEVSWYTTQFGWSEKLASGAAVLYRN